MKKKKMFVCSDVHSYLDPLKQALKQAGYDPNNEDHLLVSCGDLFDRGPESEELLHYIMSTERKILVKGNHDLLLDECCRRGFPYSHDKHNGTVKTINDIGGAGEGRSFDECCIRTLNKTARYRELLVNYFETQNYIFVHSWIPINVEFEGNSKPWYQQGKTLTWMEDWRNANDVEWEEAMWGNPFVRADQDLNKTGKTIVFGHFHTSHQWHKDGKCSEFDKDAIFDPYFGKDYIALDACTAHTGEVNVLVLEDELLDD